MTSEVFAVTTSCSVLNEKKNTLECLFKGTSATGVCCGMIRTLRNTCTCESQGLSSLKFSNVFFTRRKHFKLITSLYKSSIDSLFLLVPNSFLCNEDKNMAAWAEFLSYSTRAVFNHLLWLLVRCQCKHSTWNHKSTTYFYASLRELCRPAGDRRNLIYEY